MTVCVLMCMSLFSFLRSYALKALIGLCINFSHILISTFGAANSWSFFVKRKCPCVFDPPLTCYYVSAGLTGLYCQQPRSLTNQRPALCPGDQSDADTQDWQLAMPGVKTTQTASLTAWAWAWSLSSVTSLRSELRGQREYFYDINNLPQNMSK